MRALLLLAVVGCSRPPLLTPSDVYGELVDAGCMAATPDGVKAVADEQAAGTDPWMTCLFQGGTVASCGVPCK